MLADACDGSRQSNNFLMSLQSIVAASVWLSSHANLLPTMTSSTFSLPPVELKTQVSLSLFVCFLVCFCIFDKSCSGSGVGKGDLKCVST